MSSRDAKNQRSSDQQRVEVSATDVERPQARDELLMQAVLAFQEGRLDEAESLAERTLRLVPRFSPALQLLGMIAGRTGRGALAIKWLREAAARDHESADTRIEL